MEDNGDKLSDADKAELGDAVKAAQEVLDNNKEAVEAEVFTQAQEKLQAASHKMAEALYKQAGAEGQAPGADGSAASDVPPAGAADDDVIDAEYTESPKDGKDS